MVLCSFDARFNDLQLFKVFRQLDEIRSRTIYFANKGILYTLVIKAQVHFILSHKKFTTGPKEVKLFSFQLEVKHDVID